MTRQPRAFNAVSGIKVTTADNKLTITGSAELSGEAANAAAAAKAEASINAAWNTTFPGGGSSTCNVRVTYRAKGAKAKDVLQIEYGPFTGPSHAKRGWWGFGDWMIKLNSTEADPLGWTVGHEFGHALGLKDRYDESAQSRKSAWEGGARTTTPQAGYQSNLMATPGGTLEQKNVTDLQEETAPGAWSISDDDEVRAYVAGHSEAQLSMLSTDAALSAIRILMGGDITNEDVDAICKIMESVTNPATAKAIRDGIDELTFGDIGHRTRFKVAAVKMPK